MRKLLAFFLAGVAAFCVGAENPGNGYRLLQTYTLGGDGGWDYISLDSAARRLYIARATRVMVVDADSGRLVGELGDTPGVHGVALVPELKRAFTSNGRDNSVTIFDLTTLKALSKVPTAEGPDAIIYDPASRRVFVFNGRGKSATAIDAAEGKAAGTIPLDGRPEFAVPDGKGRVFVNLEDKGEIAVLDSQKLAVAARWSLVPCEEPTGLALDAQHRRLFVGCRNRKMAVVNADSGKVVATLPIGEGVDATAFDPGAQLAFASNWDGTLTIVHEEAPDQYTVVGNATTALGARTMAFDSKTHEIFLVTAKYQSPGADRRAIVPGSFELLVMGPQTPASK